MEAKKRIKWTAVLFIGTVSLIFIYDSFDFNHNKIKTNETKISNKRLKTMQTKSSTKSPTISPTISRREVIEKEFFVLEQKFLKNARKIPKNSKLISGQQILPIRHLVLGEQCGHDFGRGLLVVIVVISRADGFSRRQLIRDTWKKSAPEEVKVFFGVGLPRDNGTQARIEAESARARDVLQWSFVDDYYNLTIKSLAILRHFALHCLNARFLYKVDDDSLLNIQTLVNFLKSKARENVIYGHRWKKAFVDRNPNSKFFVSRLDFAPNSYPDYTGGPWLMSGSVPARLYSTTLRECLPALPFEDVFVTGVVANRARVLRQQLPGLVLFSKEMFNKVTKCWFREVVIFWQAMDERMMRAMWRNIQQEMICLLSNGSFSEYY